MGHEDCKTVGGVPAPIPVDDCGDLIDVAASSGGMETVSTAFNRRLAQQISAAVDPIWKHLGVAPPDVPSRKHAERGDDWHEQIADEQIRDWNGGWVGIGNPPRIVRSTSPGRVVGETVYRDIRAWFVGQLERAGRRAAAIERRRNDERWAEEVNKLAKKIGVMDITVTNPSDVSWLVGTILVETE